MISKATTLILGAGASKDYGFPLGRELVDLILDKLEHPEPLGIYKILADLGCSDPKQIGEFVTNLKGSNLDSIDEFLSKQPRFSDLAKKCIALVLIPFEKPDKISRDGWYRHLSNRLFEGVSRRRFHYSDVSIISFNYDRSLEQYLINCYRHTYDVKYEAAEREIGFMNIVHVYGQLARLGGQGHDARVYDPSLDAEFVQRAANQIYTVHDKSKIRSDEISDILEKKQRVYFFGFGYSDFSLAYIDFKRDYFPQVFGTSVGLGKADKMRIRRKWGIKLPGTSKNITQFIKDYAPLD